MGSDTGELYRVNINHAPYSMNFEMVSGDRPVGKVMHVVARRQIATLSQEHGDDEDIDHPEEIILNTDFLIYSGEQGDGGVLAIKEEETQIDLFAIAHLQNCAPTLDFCMRESSIPGRDTLYVCTGMKTQGAIQKIRSGISVESSGSSGNQFFAGATGLWGIKTQATEKVDTFLVVSFIQSTKVMHSGEGELPCFLLCTVLCGAQKKKKKMLIAYIIGDRWDGGCERILWIGLECSDTSCWEIERWYAVPGPSNWYRGRQPKYRYVNVELSKPCPFDVSEMFN